MKTAGQLGELLLIQQIRHSDRPAPPTAPKPATRRAVQLGIGDDCAILRPPSGHEILVTTDFSLEGRHFRRDWHSAPSIGHRTLARGLSDLAAMGAKPLAAFLSLAVPADTPMPLVSGFLEGLQALAAASHVILAGGDTSESPSAHIFADIVLVGSAPEGTALRRSTANPGDQLFVTGLLGGAAAELLHLQAPAGRRKALRRAGDHPQLFPQPRLATGWALRQRRLATACMDLSDGLSSDLAKLCEASSVAAEIDLTALPIHPLAQARGAEALSLALHGGEDYELLFTARPGTRVPRSLAGVPLTRIGQIVEPQPRSQPSRQPRSQRIVQIDYRGRRSPLPPGGWEHL